jgi:hypothetical protein
MKEPSASFEYTAVTIPLSCLRSLHTLSLSENEWAGRFEVDANCRAGCDIDLIEGSVIEARTGPEALLYLGKDKAYDENKQFKPIRLASVYIPWELYSVSDPCGSGVNVLFHTHPLLLVRDKETHIARIALPSMGDIFVHCVLANLESYDANGHAVCTLIVSFEGCYLYSILPHKFRQVYDRRKALIAGGKTAEEAEKVLRQETFDALRPANDAFFKAMKAHCDARPDLFGTDGAPDIRNAMWDRKGATPDELDFPFARAIGTPAVTEMARSNPFTEGLIEQGFHCDFYPAPFTEDLTLLAPSKITMIENRST